MDQKTFKAEDFFKEVEGYTVMAPTPHQVWSGIFLPVDIPCLKELIQADASHQYWIRTDKRDGLIYIDGMGKEPRRKKDVPEHY